MTGPDFLEILFESKMSGILTVRTCFTLAIASWIVEFVDAGGCPANGFPIVEMCKGGSASSGTVLMDFFGASSYPAPVCKCEALIIRGKSFQFSQVAAPGYQGCGTEIHIQKNVGGDQGGSILKCYGGTSIDVRPGDSLTITLYKHAPPTDTRYCYRIDITGNTHAAVSLTCTRTPTPSPLPSPPTTIKSTGQGQTLTSETTPSPQTKTTTDPMGNGSNKGLQDDAFVNYVSCNNTNYFTAVVLLTVCLGLLSIYAIIATYKLLQRKNLPNPDEPSSSTDIYEEIPAKMYISTTPVYRDSFNSHTSSSPRFKDPLPDIPPSQAPCRSCSNVSLIPIQENTSSVWNWTYNDDKNPAAIITGVKDAPNEHLQDNYDIPSLDFKQEYEFPKFEYENARF